jgi:hypothetical protein
MAPMRAIIFKKQGTNGQVSSLQFTVYSYSYIMVYDWAAGFILATASAFGQW